MVACLLCMQEKLNQIRLCSQRGLELNISSIIAKHFWLKPNIEKNPKDRICLVCWRTVREFHEFYEYIAQAHNYLELTDLNEIVADPLPDFSESHSDQAFSIPIQKLEEHPSEKCIDLNATVTDNYSNYSNIPDPLPTKSEEYPSGQCIIEEVKIEINAEELTPEIEVSDAEVNTSRRALRANRRSQRKTQDPNLKLAKNESWNSKSDDSETEIPLSIFIQNASKLPNHKKPRFKKRGRPTKITKISSQPLTVKVKTELKTEEISEHEYALMEDEHEEDTAFISENATSDSDGLSDIDPPERFAELITPRNSDKPKKKRIRDRRNAPYRRMTKEEIEMKRLEQEKYDEIIAKFFDNFPCPKCSLLVCTFGEMRKHFNTAHGGTAPSVMCCGRRFQMRKGLADHVLFHFNPEQFKCLQCGQFLQDSYTLKQHEKTHTQTQEEKPLFDCQICTKSLKTKTSLKEHLATKHTPKSEYQFACEECSKKFPTKGTLKKHMQTTHRSGTLVICEKCGKSLQSKTALNYHTLNEHSNVPRTKPPPVECPICKASLRCEFTLKEHIISIHEEPKDGSEYRCHICGYLSVNARALKRHIVYNHETERKFKCTMCEKAFKLKATLKEHITMHTGEGRYECPECSMTFACKANFHKHKQRRHGHKPVKHNFIGIAERKRQKIKAAAEKQTESSLCYLMDDINEQNVESSL